MSNGKYRVGTRRGHEKMAQRYWKKRDKYESGKKTKFRAKDRYGKLTEYGGTYIGGPTGTALEVKTGPGKSGTGESTMPKKRFFQTRKGYAKKYAKHMPEYTRHYDSETKTYTDQKTGPQLLTFKRGRRTVQYEVKPGEITSKQVRIKQPKTLLPRKRATGRYERVPAGKFRTKWSKRRGKDVEKKGGLWSAKDYQGKGQVYDTATYQPVGRDYRIHQYTSGDQIVKPQERRYDATGTDKRTKGEKYYSKKHGNMHIEQVLVRKVFGQAIIHQNK
jgi:hypothetical protein